MSNKTSFFSGSGVTTNQTNAIQSSVEAAEADRIAAAASAAAAAASATTSSTKAGEASTSAASSETSKLASVAAKAAAETAETNSETAETNAETAEAAALVSKNSASASASTATTKASEASTSADAALVSKNSATASAATATTKAAEGVVSAAAALVSKNASVAAQAAAETAETNSETAEAASLVSKNAAAASAAAALISKNSATASAATATTKAGEAATSASSITGAQSASNASAVAAAASQVAAAASAASAATTYDTFDDRYLGAKSGFAGAGTGPSTDNDGNALVEGALFFSSAANEMRVFDGSGFIAASAAGSVSINTFRYTATAGQTTFSGSDEASNTLAYTVGNILLSLNGVLLEIPTDVVAASGTSIVLQVAAELNDEVNITVFKSFTTADMVSATTGGTHQALVNFSAGINVTGNILASGLVDGVDIAARDAVLSSTVTTANAALPKAGGALTGAVTTNSTFDGVDIATRDAVLTATTATANAALPKSGGALTGALTTNSTIDGRDVAADGVTADAALPKSGGAMTGAITTNSTFDGRDVAADGVTADAALPKAGGAVTGNVTFGDGNKAIFGAGSDLQVYHNGTHSFVANTTGDMNLQTTGAMYLTGSTINLYDGSTTRLAVAGGKVGIGTSAPDQKLHITDGTSSGAVLRLERSDTSMGNNDVYGGIEFEGNDTDTNANGIRGFIRGLGQGTGGGMKLEFGTAGGGAAIGAARMTLDADGNVGINTSSPISPLHIRQNTSDGYTSTSFNDKCAVTIEHNNADTNYSGMRFTNSARNYEHFFGSVQTSVHTADMVFQGYDRAANVYKEYLRIDDGGSITASAHGTTGATIRLANINSGSSSHYIELSGNLPGFTNGLYNCLKTSLSDLHFAAGNTYTGYINSNGGFTDVSDAVLKENVVTIDGALNKSLQLRGRYFTWINENQTDDRQIGFIAQEVEAVVPELVTTSSTGIKGVSYGKTAALLVEAIKEQQTLIEALTARITALEDV
jgi:hypothetical protein